MENKQTAIDYIVNVVNSCIAPDYIPNEIVNQAKEMEKEQIINTFKDAQLFKVMNYETRAEQYYNQLYGK